MTVGKLKQISLRLSDEEWDALERKCNETGASKNRYVRILIRRDLDLGELGTDDDNGTDDQDGEVKSQSNDCEVPNPTQASNSGEII